ncbi:hypothetical protein ScPMuIL_010013 [Solemya velum]
MTIPDPIDASKTKNRKMGSSEKHDLDCSLEEGMTENTLYTILENAVLFLCRESYPSTPSLEIDAIICISSKKGKQDHVVKIHRTVYKNMPSKCEKSKKLLQSLLCVNSSSSKQGHYFDNDGILISNSSEDSIQGGGTLDEGELISRCKAQTETEKLDFNETKNSPPSIEIMKSNVTPNEQSKASNVTSPSMIKPESNQLNSSSSSVSRNRHGSQKVSKCNRHTAGTGECNQNENLSQQASYIHNSTAEEPVDESVDSDVQTNICSSASTESLHVLQKYRDNTANNVDLSIVKIEQSDHLLEANCLQIASPTDNKIGKITSLAHWKSTNFTWLVSLQALVLVILVKSRIKTNFQWTVSNPHDQERQTSLMPKNDLPLMKHHKSCNSKYMDTEDQYLVNTDISESNIVDPVGEHFYHRNDKFVNQNLTSNENSEVYLNGTAFSSQELDESHGKFSKVKMSSPRTSVRNTEWYFPYGTDNKRREKKFFCKYCGAGFTMNCTKVRHERTTCSGAAYKCDFCDAKFSRTDSKARHMLTSHGIKSSRHPSYESY